MVSDTALTDAQRALLRPLAPEVELTLDNDVRDGRRDAEAADRALRDVRRDAEAADRALRDVLRQLDGESTLTAA